MSPHPPRLDPRRPLVVDTRALGRRAGSMQELRRSVPAPAGLQLEVVAVPPEAELGLDLRLEAVMDGVLVSGTVSAPVRGECGRCLHPLEAVVEAPLQQLYAYEPGPDPDDETDRLVGDLLDLEPAVRDAVVLALPFTPLCRPDCPGLCPRCGVRLDAVGPEHHHEEIDPRWAALRAVAGTDGRE